MKYKTDLHCHTSAESSCASEDYRDTVDKYIREGYTSFVLTNHFTEEMRGDLLHADYVKRYFDEIRRAQKYAAGRINVIEGVELKLGNNDYLIFGVSEEILADFPQVFDGILRDAYNYFHSKGCVLIQAHPFRYGMRIVRPVDVDGYEVMNTHHHHDSRNAFARMWAEQVGGKDKILTAGTDHHDACQIPDAGILTDEPIKNSDDLLRILKAKKYEIFPEN